MKVQSLVRKCIRIRILFGLIVAGSVVLVALKTFSADENGAGETNRSAETVDATEPNKAPIIIWFHNGYSDNVAALKTALSSRLISHVMIKCMHRKDFDYRSKKDVLKAIEIVKKSGAKLIWSRGLWTLYDVEGSSAKDFFDPDYYIRELQILRWEGKEVGADFVAIDNEPYAYTPVKKHWRGRKKVSPEERERLNRVISEVVGKIGKVEFVYPGGYIRSEHPANILSKLGKFRIATDTYWFDEKRIKSIQYEYEIFGAYINTVRDDGRWRRPYFLVSDIFERSDLWSDKKGLFLYSREHNALAVAQELAAYSRQLPFKTYEPGQSSNLKRQ